jgi:glycosyltransferase involved in cell wall biosynthesis
MKRQRCLYISRYAPERTRTDPYTGLPWFLSERTDLYGLWGKSRKLIAFQRNCQRIEETNPSWQGIFQSFFLAHQFLRHQKKLDGVICGIDEYSLAIGVFAGKYMRVPVFCVVEDPPFTGRYFSPLQFIQKKERLVRHFLIRRLLALCSGIFCFIEKDVLNGITLGKVPIYQMMNGVSQQALAWVEGNSSNQKESPGFVIGYVGAINEKQGIEDLLEIFAGARKKLPHAKLLLIGPLEDEYRGRFRAHIDDLMLASSVETTGWLPYEKMLEKLQLSDICVYCNPPTEWFRYAQPLKICEYLALRKPTVAWNYPGTRRMLGEGRYGILVAPGNRSAFLDALLFLADPTVRDPIAREIQIAIKGRWSSDYWYERVLDILTNRAGARFNERRQFSKIP